MTPEAAQDLQAYFGMNLFGDDSEDKEDEDQNMDEVRKAIRKEIRNVLSEYGTEADPGRATAASPGGPGTDWFYIARLISDVARSRREIEDIGKREVGGETVHEFSVQGTKFQIKKSR